MCSERELGVFLFHYREILGVVEEGSDEDGGDAFNSDACFHLVDQLFIDGFIVLDREEGEKAESDTVAEIEEGGDGLEFLV